MALLGENNVSPYKSRQEARIMNCNADGSIAKDEKRTLTFSKTNPVPGMWDLPLFGSYMYAASKYKIRVDYVTGSASVKDIEMSVGLSDDPTVVGIIRLSGSFKWVVKEASIPANPDPTKSSLELAGLAGMTKSKVAKDNFVVVENSMGQKFRSYPDAVNMVVIKTGNSSGNDIDLAVFECPEKPQSLDDCTDIAGKSAGPTDQEAVVFAPEQGKTYAVRVDGYDVKNDGSFLSSETLFSQPEDGELTVAADSGVNASTTVFNVGYAISKDDLAKSELLNSELFKSGKYFVVGDVTLKTADDNILGSVPVIVTK
jgi:hypothetical protein